MPVGDYRFGTRPPSNFDEMNKPKEIDYNATRNPLVTPRQRMLNGQLQTFYPKTGQAISSPGYIPGVSDPTDFLDVSQVHEGVMKPKPAPGTPRQAAPAPASQGGAAPGYWEWLGSQGQGGAVTDPNGSALMNSLLGGGGFQWGLDNQKKQTNQLLSMLGY